MIGSLSNDDGDGNKNGKKAIGINWKNNNSARASRFFVHTYFLAVVAQQQREKVPDFTFCWGRAHKHETTTFLFFSWTLIQSFRIQLRTNLPTFGELNKNKGDKVRGSANSLFKWRFRSRRSRCCLSSLSHDACSVRDDIVFTLYVRMRMFENGEKKSPAAFKNMDQCRFLGNCPPPPPLS